MGTGLVFSLLLFSTAAHAQTPPRSGLEFAGPELRALQQDDGANPGMLWVDRGAALWRQDCARCHGEPASMRGVAARYPALDSKSGKPLNLEGRINQCRVERMKASALAYESEGLLSLTAIVAHQSRGMPITVEANDESKKHIASGRAEYYRRRGQMNLACANCHEQNWGKRLGAETLSQGHPNGYPAYRLEWQSLGSTHRRLRSCFYGLRAELPPFGSDELTRLELFLAWRARGLPLESPAVRR